MLPNDFKNRMKTILGDEYDLFIKEYDKSPVRGLRINKNKIGVDEFLKINPFNLEKIALSDDCYYFLDEDKVGRHPLHHAGFFYMQDPSAMLPAYSYQIKDGINILDLCAAPGGKTSQLACINPNGVVISNEIMRDRSKILFSNIERLGFKNVIVTNNDSSELADKLEGFFDLILVDAPCSGEGMFRKDKKAIEDWSLSLVELNSKRQKEILENANKLLKKDGILIYSTCTFSKEENEDNVNYLINEFNYELLKPTDECMCLSKPYIIPYARRSYHHHNKGEGQFFAVLKKNSEAIELYNEEKIKKSDLKIVNEFLDTYLEKYSFNIRIYNDSYYHVPSNVSLKGLNVVSYGVNLGSVIKNRFVPHHNLFTAFGHLFKNKVNLDFNSIEIKKYLHGEEITYDCPNGYGCILVNNVALGGFKATNKVLKNHYPKGLRNF